MPKKKGGFLSTLFKAVASATALGAMLVVGMTEGKVILKDRQFSKTHPDGQALTPGEKALVKSIFGDAVDVDKIRKHLRDEEHPTAAATVQDYSRRHINFWEKFNHSFDYSKERGWLQGLFMHEVTHIWQHQSSLTVYHMVARRCNPGLEDKYAYKLSPQSHFDDYCSEQQGEMVQDYVKQVLYPFKGRPGVERAIDKHLAKVIEEKFPQARLTRLKLEAEYDKNNDKSKRYRVPYRGV